MKTREDWLATAANGAIDVASGQGMPKGFQCRWWIHREIRVFWERDIPRQTVDVVVEACQERIAECGLPEFEFEIVGPHWSVDQQLVQCARGREIDHDRFDDLCLREEWRDEDRGGRQHGDIVITRYELLDDPASWGVTGIRNGTILFGLHGKRPSNHSFLRKVALHEMGHLLGAAFHCDETRHLSGYRYDPQCSMHYSCTGDTLCMKCKEFVRTWWRALGVI